MNGRSPILAGATLVGLVMASLWLVRVPSGASPRGAGQPAASAVAEVCAPMERSDGTDALATTVFLVDESLTFYSSASFQRAADSFAMVSAAVLRAHAKPHRVVVGTIGSPTLDRLLVCDKTIPPGGIFRRACSDDQVRASLGECARRLAARAGTRTTDVTGALAFAATHLQAATSLSHTLVVFSDFQEDLGPRRAASAAARTLPEMRSTCAVLYFDFMLGEAVALADAERRARAWERRLRSEALVRGVLVRPVNSLSTRELASFLDACERASRPSAPSFVGWLGNLLAGPRAEAPPGEPTAEGDVR